LLAILLDTPPLLLSLRVQHGWQRSLTLARQMQGCGSVEMTGLNTSPPLFFLLFSNLDTVALTLEIIHFHNNLPFHL
jgi:hypothetical protein